MPERIATFKPETAREMLAAHHAQQRAPRPGVRETLDEGEPRNCRTQIVAVDGSGEQSPNGDGLFPGTIQLFDAGNTYSESGWDDGAACWIAVLNQNSESTSSDDDEVKLEGGKRYIAWRVGSVTAAGEESPRPLLVISFPPAGDSHGLGKADGAIAAGAPGYVSIFTGPAGSETDSGDDVLIFNRTDSNIPNGGWVHYIRINGNVYGEPWSCT
jgi:hypothetical protein